MSNSAVIKIDKTPLCIYTKWHGTFADVVAYAGYAKLRNFGSPDVDPSGITSLIQVMANCAGGGFGVEVLPYEDAKKYETEKGTYVLEEWDVVDIEGHRGSEHAIDEDIVERIVRIDACQPESLRLGDGFIRDIASRKATFAGELAVGDVIWDRGDSGAPVRATIVGFGDSGYPYVHVDSDPSFDSGKPQVPDHYAREHFGKFLGNAGWYARIPELSHPQAKAASFRSRPAELNGPGQISAARANAVEAAEESFEDPTIFPASDEDTQDWMGSAETLQATQGAIVESFSDAGIIDDDFEDLDMPDSDDLELAVTESLGEALVSDGSASDANFDGFAQIESYGNDPNDSAEFHLGNDFTDAVFSDGEATQAPPEEPSDDDEDDDYGDDDFVGTDTYLLQMVASKGEEEDEFSITNGMVIPSSDDLSATEDGQQIIDNLGDFVDEGTKQHIVMTNAGSDTEKVKIIQPLPQDEAAIDAVTIHASDTGRSVFIPLEPHEIEPDFSTDEIAKNPRPYPDVLDANFQPYEED